MAEKIVKLSTSEISRAVADFTVGLVRLVEKDHVEDAACAGSGTLVTIGSVHGILTAAHVIEELPAIGEVGIVLYREMTFQKQVLRLENVEKIVIRGNGFGPDGPDLGFLRIPHENVGWLKATSSFFNLNKRRDEHRASYAPSANYVDAVIGMIDELTIEVPVDKPKRRAKAFSAIFCNGETCSARNVDDCDLLDFSVTSYSDFKLPQSFEGMSGGALWRIYFEAEGELPSIVGKRLVGVPFYQFLDKDGHRVITCQGPNSIYETLIDRAVVKWPEAQG
jgi:hypothetical protein